MILIIIGGVVLVSYLMAASTVSALKEYGTQLQAEMPNIAHAVSTQINEAFSNTTFTVGTTAAVSSTPVVSNTAAGEIINAPMPSCPDGFEWVRVGQDAGCAPKCATGSTRLPSGVCQAAEVPAQTATTFNAQQAAVTQPVQPSIAPVCGPGESAIMEGGNWVCQAPPHPLDVASAQMENLPMGPPAWQELGF